MRPLASTGFRELQARLTALGQTEPFMRALQISTISEAQKLVHRKTGFLQRNIVPGAVSKDRAVIAARTPYAAALEFGAKPHIIRPKNAKVLAWGGSRRLTGRLRSGGKATHFAALVHHPGSKPYPYLIPGARRAVKSAGLRDVIVKTWNTAA